MRQELQSVLETCSACPLFGRRFREFCMEQLGALSTYDWSGVYRLEGDTLLLDAYVGAPTDHTRIPVGRGVCGTAVSQRANQVVDDVGALENYLSCSLETKSEIVVLIWKDDAILGQIDIDSHQVGAFGAEDEALLAGLAALIGARWTENPEP